MDDTTMPTSLDFEDYLSKLPLPPHWISVNTTHFENLITKEEIDEHPMKKVLHNINRGCTVAKDQTVIECRCHWQEPGSTKGKSNTQELIFKYYVSDGHTVVSISGISGEWSIPQLADSKGFVVERHDLTIGSRVNIFGRILSISTVDPVSCDWIDAEFRRLGKQKEHFQMRIEKLGISPVIRRIDASTGESILRSSSCKGKCNLRKMLHENAQLGEQLAQLGLARILEREGTSY